MKKILALMALTTLTACDLIHRPDVRSERDDRRYRAAMDDYRAGRIEVAIEGFRQALAGNPLNSSARFQLACLLQDSRKDFVGAYCCYREYLLQQPNSDKAKLARERMALCEKEAAKELATKYGLSGGGAAEQDLAGVRGELKAAQDRAGTAEKDLAAAQKRLQELTEERDRLAKVVKGVGEGASQEPVTPTAVLKEAKDLLEEGDEESALSASPTELAEIRKEASDEESLRETAPKQVAGKTNHLLAKKEKPAEAAPERPKTYQVQEGDTLYGVAKRFYGTITVWKMIREANKALIPMDNRLRAGDTIVLP